MTTWNIIIIDLSAYDKQIMSCLKYGRKAEHNLLYGHKKIVIMAKYIL